MQILLVLTVVFGLSTAASAQQTFVIDKPIAGNLAIVVKHSLDRLEFNPPTQMDTQVAGDGSIQTLLEYPSVVSGVTLNAGNLSEDDAYLCAAARSSTGALVSIPDGMRIPEGAPANDPLLGDAEQIRFDAGEEALFFFPDS
jgi:hypothetical protein